MFRRRKPRRGVSDEEWVRLRKQPAVDYRAQGPFTVDEVELDDGVQRLDFGGLVVTPWPGLTVTGFAQEAGGVVTGLLWEWDSLIVELALFADSTNGSVRDSLLASLVEEATKAGGHAQPGQGPFGSELQLVSKFGEADRFHQVRVWPISGPSWLLRVALVDEAARLGPEDPRFLRLLAGVRAICVRRGAEAMIPGTIITLSAVEVL